MPELLISCFIGHEVSVHTCYDEAPFCGVLFEATEKELLVFRENVGFTIFERVNVVQVICLD